VLLHKCHFVRSTSARKPPVGRVTLGGYRYVLVDGNGLCGSVVIYYSRRSQKTITFDPARAYRTIVAYRGDRDRVDACFSISGFRRWTRSWTLETSTGFSIIILFPPRRRRSYTRAGAHCFSGLSAPSRPVSGTIRYDGRGRIKKFPEFIYRKKTIFHVAHLIIGIKSIRNLLSVGLIVKTTLVSRLPRSCLYESKFTHLFEMSVTDQH